MFKCWLAEEALEFGQRILKITRWFIHLNCTTITAVVSFEQAGPIQHAGRHIVKFRPPYNVYADEFGLLHYSFVDVQGV